MSVSAPRRFTGRHMAIIMVAFFAVVIAVNLTMARLAGASFTGVVVENSYVASQHYNRWLEEARAEEKLGWKADARRAADGHLLVRLDGVPTGATVLAHAWHPLGRATDHTLQFAADGEVFRSTQALPEGRWRVRIEVNAAGQRWRTERSIS